MNAVVLIAVAICFAFFVLQIVAIGQLTGERRSTGEKYFALCLVAGWFLILVIWHHSLGGDRRVC